MIFAIKVQTLYGDQFINLTHYTHSINLPDGSLRLWMVGGGAVEICGKSAELVRSHLDGMAIDMTGAPLDPNYALKG